MAITPVVILDAEDDDSSPPVALKSASTRRGNDRQFVVELFSRETRGSFPIAMTDPAEENTNVNPSPLDNQNFHTKELPKLPLFQTRTVVPAMLKVPLPPKQRRLQLKVPNKPVVRLQWFQPCQTSSGSDNSKIGIWESSAHRTTQRESSTTFGGAQLSHLSVWQPESAPGLVFVETYFQALLLTFSLG